MSDGISLRTFIEVCLIEAEILEQLDEHGELLEKFVRPVLVGIHPYTGVQVQGINRFFVPWES